MPVHFHRRRHDDEHLRDLFTIKEALAKRSDLDSLTEPHVVTENTALPLFVQVVEPDDAFFLVLKEALVDFLWQAEPVAQAVFLFFLIVLEATCILPLR